MSLKPSKPIEPIIVLIGALILLIIGLNLNFVSLKLIGVTFIPVTGIEIPLMPELFGASVIFSILALLVYHFGKSRQTTVLARNLTIIGLIPGFVGTFMILTDFGQIKQFLIQKVISLHPSLSVAQAQTIVDFMNPDIGLGVAFAGLLLMMLGAYLLHISKFSSTELATNSVLYPDLTQIDSADEINFNTVNALWYCPKDNTKLSISTSKISSNAEFRVSQERLEDNIENAVSMRIIHPEIVPYTKSLAMVLLKKSKNLDIGLVSTRCPTCRDHYISPKLSEWYNN